MLVSGSKCSGCRFVQPKSSLIPSRPSHQENFVFRDNLFQTWIPGCYALLNRFHPFNATMNCDVKSRKVEEEEIPISPAPDLRTPDEIFSSKKKIFFLSPYPIARHSDIPHLESDYCPRDETSRRLFRRRHRHTFSCHGLYSCMGRYRPCIWKTVFGCLGAFVFLVLFRLLYYNLISPDGTGGYFLSGGKSNWITHYHNFAFVETDAGAAGSRTNSEYRRNSIQNRYETLDKDSEKNSEEVESLFIRPFRVSPSIAAEEMASNELLVIPEGREPRKREKKSVERIEDVDAQALLQKGTRFLEKWPDFGKRIEIKKFGLKTNVKAVFHPFNLSPTTFKTPGLSVNSPEEVSREFEALNNASPSNFYYKTTEEEFESENPSKKLFSAENRMKPPTDDYSSANFQEYSDPSLEEIKEVTRFPTSTIMLNPKEEGIADSQIASTYEKTLDVDATTEENDGERHSGGLGHSMVEAISLAEAAKIRNKNRKHMFLNSKVVGGSSDVRIPTGPDSGKPGVSAIETLKTDQQLSFTPSAASSFVFPYQMCLFANPYSGAKFLNPSIRSTRPRTFSLGTSLLSPVSDTEDNKPRYPAQQNFLSFSVNNYASSPTRQQGYYPPTGAPFFGGPSISPLHSFFPSSPQQVPPGNLPFPGSQPIFCTYLQPPVFQFPTVPGTADFSHRKCDACESDKRFSSIVEDKLFNSGRMTMPCSGDNVSCRDGTTCVPIRKWCDNEIDCLDASDESFCSCRERVIGERLCDGYLDCPNGEDETGCFGCPKTAFSCDSVITPESCIPLNKRCDGIRDCSMGNDEIDCSVLFFHIHQNHSYRISHGQGFLHRNWRGEWFPVCVDMVSDAWAKEACLGELGFLPSTVEVDFAAVPDYYKGPFIVRNENGVPSLQYHCKGHLSTYVKCPDVKCGTSAEFHNLQDFENRFVRSKRGSLNGNGTLPLKRIFRSKKEKRKAKREETVRVVGGRESDPKAWPWAVAIYKDGGFLCGGVVLDKLWVLTAAHCMELYWKHFYEVRGGMLRRFSFSPMEQVRTVGAVIVHENYNPTIMSNDLALLRLTNPFHFNRWVRPACLPNFKGDIPNLFSSPMPGSRCIAIGWGALKERGTDADQLREVEVPIMSRCKHKEDLAGAEICAGRAEGGKDTCQGDSGGPLLCKTSRSPWTWYVAGIVSHGEGCARPGEPGAYTRISLFLDWIIVNANDFKLTAIQPLINCPGFRCTSATKLCIPKKWICNGYTDCLEAEDEKNCTSDLYYDQYINQISFENMPKTFRTEENGSISKNKSFASLNEVSENKSNSEKSFPNKIKNTEDECDQSNKKGAMVLPVNSLKKNQKEDSKKAEIKLQTSQSLAQSETTITSAAPTVLSFESDARFILTSFANVDGNPKLSPKREEIRLNEDATLETDTMHWATTEQTYFSSSPELKNTRENAEFENSDKTTNADVNGSPQSGLGSLILDSTVTSDGQNISRNALFSVKGVDSIFEIEKRERDVIIKENESNSKQLGHENTNRNLTSIPRDVNETDVDLASNKKNNLQSVKLKSIRKDDLKNESASIYFQCREIVQSILKDYVCDGIQDCEDETDETGCSCLEVLMKAEPNLVCDGLKHCQDGSDEKKCEPCASEEYHCIFSGECLPILAKCNGVPECRDGEDESSCFALSATEEVELDARGEPKLETGGLVLTYNDGNWSLLCQSNEEGIPFDGKLAGEVCSHLGWFAYDQYESVELSPECVSFRVNCSETLVNSLEYYKSSGNGYLWPWNGFLYLDGEYTCSAVWLRSEWLLAAFDCLQNFSLSDNYLSVKLGRKNVFAFDGAENDSLIQIDAVRFYPEYGAALLHLSEKPKRNRFVRPLGIPYVLNSNPKKDVCVVVGEETILLKISRNCSDSETCYQRMVTQGSHCDFKRQAGIVVCQSRMGWFPSSIFQVQGEGDCDLARFTFTNIQPHVNILYSFTKEKADIRPESLSNCSGFRCLLGSCIADERICDGSPDCPFKEDESLDMCQQRKSQNDQCKAFELKCRNGRCVSKRFFGDGKDDCGDGSDEPENVTCAKYLELTDPGKICNGIRNCFDKTDENIRLCSCDPSKFKCQSSGDCVPEDFVCDGEKDCPGGEDEEDCFGRMLTSVHKTKAFEIKQKSYGTWHDACPSVVNEEYADSLCRDFGLEKASLISEARQTVLEPLLDHFTQVKLNPSVTIALRSDRPIVRLIKAGKSCGIIKCV